MKFRVSRFIVGAAVALSVCGGAGFAQASSLSSAQVQAIVNLLQSFGADSTTIGSVQSALTGVASTPTTGGTSSGQGSSGVSTSPSSWCVDLSHNLYSGATDTSTEGQVSQLQKFLGVSTTGYFGSLTEQAVQEWQSSHGLVAAGTPSSTGFGFVGPKTRLAFGCGAATTTPSLGTPTASLVTSSTTLTVGQSATLAWTSTNATYCIGKEFSTLSATKGSVTVSPTKTTTYAVACGNSAATGVTANVTVVVTPVVSPSTTVAPTITTISPTTAAIGQTVTITGTGFTSKNSIHFGSTWVGPIASTNGTTLTFTVPTSAGGCDPLTFIGDMPCTAPVVQPGSYTVTVNSLPAGTTTPQTSNGVAFTVSTGVTTATAPTITAISPTTAAIGQTVAITGTGFTSANSVHVGSAWVGPIASTNNGTTLTFVVPTSSGVCDPLSSVANPASACTMQAVVLTPGAYTVTVNSLSTGATAPLASNGVSLTISGGVSTALSATLTASQTTVQSGQPVTLTWSSQNATYCTGVGFSTGGGAIYNTSALSSSAGGMNYQYTSGSGATSGSVVVYPTQTTTYGLMCGAANSSATVNASALVSVSSVTTKPACGSANGTTVASLPTANLCSVGIATQVSGSGPWTWNCVSSTASTAGAVSCSANKSSTTASSVDLIAGTVTPTTATVNTPAVLSAPIYNVGTASTVSGFTDRFEINSTTVPTSAASVATLRTNTSTALNAGGNTSVSISYLFPSVGTYYVRACANTTLNGTNTITESNYANNCGVWSPVTVR